jgi:hypothetical protein
MDRFNQTLHNYGTTNPVLVVQRITRSIAFNLQSNDYRRAEARAKRYAAEAQQQVYASKEAIKAEQAIEKLCLRWRANQAKGRKDSSVGQWNLLNKINLAREEFAKKFHVYDKIYRKLRVEYFAQCYLRRNRKDFRD